MTDAGCEAIQSDFDKGDNPPPDTRIIDLGEEREHLVTSRDEMTFAILGFDSSHHREQFLDRHVKRRRDLHQAGNRNTICSFLVFLDLLERDPYLLGQRHLRTGVLPKRPQFFA